jgi:predicted permease
MYARIAPGLSLEQASVGLDQLSRRLSGTMPELHAIAPQGWSYFLTSMLRNEDASVQRWLWILFAAVGCFLLIVCANVAGLVLLRSTERSFEFAIRLALGAGRWRITREVLAEVLVFSTLGGAAGLVIAQVGIELLARYAPGSPPHFELPVFWFCAGMSLVAGMLSGLVPAFRSTRYGAASLASGLTGEGFQKTTGMAKRRWQQALTVSQIAIATALLLCGVPLVRSLLHLLQSPLGFEPRNVLTMNISLPPQRYKNPESRGQFYDQVLEKIEALPGVEAASGGTLLPFGYGESVNTFEIVGESKQPVSRISNLSQVTESYFATMQIPLARGRMFQPEDRQGDKVVLIDGVFARKYFDGEDPIGRQIKMPWGEFTVAGIVGSVKSSSIDIDAAPTIYFDYGQSPVTDLTLAIRSSLSDGQLAREVQRIVTTIDRDQPVYDVATLQARIDRSLKSRRFVAWLMLGFALSGTLLAAIGLYGLLSYVITLRSREIGIRMALGASRGKIAEMVCRGGIALVSAGLALGACAGAGAYRFIASQTYGVGLQDPTTWIALTAAIGISGLVACAIPAVRAARCQPMEVLRGE